MFTIKKLVNAAEHGAMLYAGSRIIIACGAGFYAGCQIGRGIDLTNQDVIGPRIDFVLKWVPRFAGMAGLMLALFQSPPNQSPPNSRNQ